jgi:hypothetical protein
MPDPNRVTESWVKLYDDLLEHPKMVEAGPEAFALYCATLLYCHRNDTDGRIHAAKLRGLLDLSKPMTVAAKLVAAKLFERSGDWFQVHDYTLHQTSHADRARWREYGLQGAAIRWANRHRNEGPDREAKGPPSEPLIAKERGKRKEDISISSISHLNQEPELKLTGIEVAPEMPVLRVFDEWCKAFNRGPRTALDGQRKQVIQRALKTYTADELVMAIQGYTHDPWPERKRRNEITLLLRDAQHIEEGMALMRRVDMTYTTRGGEMQTPGQIIAAAPRGVGEPDD